MKKNYIIFKLLSLMVSISLFINMFNYDVFAKGTSNSINVLYTAPVFDSPSNNIYNKIHFYMDNEEHHTIDSPTELCNALSSLANIKTRNQKSGNDVELTVQFQSNFMNTQIYKDFLTERDDLKSIPEARDFRERLNTYSKNYHDIIYDNNAYLLSSFENTDFVHIDYSPFAVCTINLEQINSEQLTNLASLDEVMNICISEKAVCEQEVSWNNTLEGISANEIVDNSIYTGQGIRIGIFESSNQTEGYSGMCDLENANLQNKNFTLQLPNGVPSDHSTAVASIIALMAPSAQFFVGDTNTGYHGLEWFIDNNCDVVNCSFGLPHTVYHSDTDTYTTINNIYRINYDGLYDYQINANLITVIKSAGNYNNDNTDSSYNPNYQVTSPGLAYNVITVGGITQRLGNNVHSSHACYVSNIPYIKPEVSAYYTVSIPSFILPQSGTSFAAPQVTAAVAMIMESNPACIANPAKVKSILISTAEKTHDYTLDRGNFDDKVGAGVVNVEKAVSDNYNRTYTINVSNDALSGDRVFTVTFLMNAGETLNVALAWYGYSEYNEANNDEQNAYAVDYRVVIDRSSTSYASSNTAFSNVELIRYTAESTGYYSIIVYKIDTLTNPIGDTLSLAFNHE